MSIIPPFLLSIPKLQRLALDKDTCADTDAQDKSTSSPPISPLSTTFDPVCNPAFRDPYATVLSRRWLLFEASLGLSMLETWEKCMILTVLLLVLLLVTLGLIRLPGTVLFAAQRLQYHAAGRETVSL